MTHLKDVYVIRHINTSTLYGLSNNNNNDNISRNKYSKVVCFKHLKHARHVMSSIITFKYIYNKNPSGNKLCVYNNKELLNHLNFNNKDLQYNLLIQKYDFCDLLDNLLNRCVGVYLIEDLNYHNNYQELKSIELIPNDKVEKVYVDCIKSNFDI